MKDIRDINWNDDVNKFGNPSDDETDVMRPGVYGVCVKNDKILIVKSRLGGFIIGGGIEESESDIECLKRETLEEIGYNIDVKEWLEDVIEYVYVPERDMSYVKT
ncbi:MAG: NUDIX domain-containing protein, partial [Acidaminobacteraceae bacterium]